MKVVRKWIGVILIFSLVLNSGFVSMAATSQDNGDGTSKNPVLFADFPDNDVATAFEDQDGDGVEETPVYYMVSTTMQMTPGCPIMKSYDLVNWELVNYCYDVLSEDDTCTLSNGSNMYGRGSWAASLRYYKGTFYVAVGALNTGRTYIYQTKDIENGHWERYTLNQYYHDCSLIFDDQEDGNVRVYLVYGGGPVEIVELNESATAEKENGLRKSILTKDEILAAEGNDKNEAEGAHIYKIGDYYYMTMINYNQSGVRTELCFRSKTIDSGYEGRVVWSKNKGPSDENSQGVAQGGLVQTGKDPHSQSSFQYAFIFQDQGALGRSPNVMPIA